MIYGKGGSGKTSFIQAAVTELYESRRCRYMYFPSIYKSIENNEVSGVEDLEKICLSTEIVFLDGITDMTPKGFDYSDRITGIICSIIGKVFHNHADVKLIVTGCFSEKQEAFSVLRMISIDFQLVEIVGIFSDEDCIRVLDTEKNSSLFELLKRPLYYNAYKSLDNKNINKVNGYSRYDLLSIFYDQMFQRSGTKFLDVVRFEKIIYSNIPKLAYNMLYKYYRRPIPLEGENEGLEIVVTNFDIIFTKYTDAEGKKWFYFNHQDYRDFLGAMYFKRYVDDIYHSVQTLMLDFNFEVLPDTTVSMLIEACCNISIEESDFNGRTLKKGEVKKVEWWKVYKVVDIDVETLLKCMDVGFEIGYYLADPLRHPETNKNVYYVGYERLIGYYYDIIERFTINPLPSIPIEKWGHLIEKVVRKYIELLRRAKEFDKAFLCLNKLINCLEGKIKSGLLNQKAKLLMYRAQYSDHGTSKDFLEGYKILEECAQDGNILSNNLLGRIFASPSPIIVQCLGENVRDKKKGFTYFHKTVLLTSKNKSLTLSEKYAYVRCAKMLLHKNVSIVSGSKVGEGNFLHICDQINKPEEESIQYAKWLLEHANSNSAYAMYLQGMINYYQSALTFAASQFKIVLAREVSFGKILPSLFLYQILCEDSRINEGRELLDILNDEIITGIQTLNDFDNNGGNELNFERYHPRYILEDIKYVLGFLNETNKVIREKGVLL